MAVKAKIAAKVKSQKVDSGRKQIRTVITKDGALRIASFGCAGDHYPKREGVASGTEPQRRVALELKKCAPNLSMVIDDGDTIYPDGVPVIDPELRAKLLNDELSEAQKEKVVESIQSRIDTIHEYFPGVYSAADQNLPYRIVPGNHEASAHVSGGLLMGAWQWMKYKFRKVPFSEYLKKTEAFVEGFRDLYDEELHEKLETSTNYPDTYRNQAKLTGLTEDSDTRQYLMPDRYFTELIFKEDSLSFAFRDFSALELKGLKQQLLSFSADTSIITPELRSKIQGLSLENSAYTEVEFTIQEVNLIRLFLTEIEREDLNNKLIDNPFAVVAYMDSTLYNADEEQQTWWRDLLDIELKKKYPNVKHRMPVAHHIKGMSDDKRSEKKKERVYPNPKGYAGNLHRTFAISSSEEGERDLSLWHILLGAHSHDVSILDFSRVRDERIKKLFPRMQAVFGAGGATSSKNKQKMSAYTTYTESGLRYGFGVCELSDETRTIEYHDCSGEALLDELKGGDRTQEAAPCSARIHTDLEGNRIEANDQRLPEHQQNKTEKSQHFHPGFVLHQKEWFDTIFSVLQSGQVDLLKWFLMASENFLKDITETKKRKGFRTKTKESWVPNEVLDDFLRDSDFSDALPDQQKLENYILKIEKIMYEYLRYDKKDRYLTPGFNELAALRTCLDEVLKQVEKGVAYSGAVENAYHLIYEDVDNAEPYRQLVANQAKELQEAGLNEKEIEEMCEDEDDSLDETADSWWDYFKTYLYPEEPPKPDQRFYMESNGKDILTRCVLSLELKFMKKHKLNNKMPDKLFDLSDEIKKGNVRSTAFAQFLVLEFLLQTAPDPMQVLAAFVQFADEDIVKPLVSMLAQTRHYRSVFELWARQSNSLVIKRSIEDKDFEKSYTKIYEGLEDKVFRGRRTYIRETLKTMDVDQYRYLFSKKGMANLFSHNEASEKTLNKVTDGLISIRYLKLTQSLDKMFEVSNDEALDLFINLLKTHDNPEALSRAVRDDNAHQLCSGKIASPIWDFLDTLSQNQDQEEYICLKRKLLDYFDLKTVLLAVEASLKSWTPDLILGCRDCLTNADTKEALVSQLESASAFGAVEGLDDFIEKLPDQPSKFAEYKTEILERFEPKVKAIEESYRKPSSRGVFSWLFRKDELEAAEGRDPLREYLLTAEA
jgi:hypothetical protein